jgi:hypothetical protein
MAHRQIYFRHRTSDYLLMICPRRGCMPPEVTMSMSLYGQLCLKERSIGIVTDYMLDVQDYILGCGDVEFSLHHRSSVVHPVPNLIRPDAISSSLSIKPTIRFSLYSVY